jgi:hypothetical protein
MFSSVRFCKNPLVLLACFWLATSLPESAAMDPRFELDAKALGVNDAPQKGVSAGAVPSRKTRKSLTARSASAKSSAHIIKPGDNLFKILIRDYGFTNDEAEAAIDLICRENNIADIRRLKVGQKIVIPSSRRMQERSALNSKTFPSNNSGQVTSRMQLRVKPPEEALSEQEASVQFQKVWDKVVPSGPGRSSADIINSASFSLSLDPQRYPTYATMDGGRILVDRNDSIPSLVKALIVEKNPSIRIVSESPVNGKQFLKGMLDSAGFYSVAEDFNMDFGFDPLLTIHSDFKVEKTAESIVKFDVLLMNAGQTSYPPAIKDFLKTEGMTVHEPFALSRPAVAASRRQLYQITSRNQTDIVDSILAAIAIKPEKNKRLDVFAADDNGISLSVKAERYFERGGQRHVITRFDGDPITYTLFRILETKGFQTVILDKQDDFRKVTEKLLSGMRIQGAYARHNIDFDAGANYSLQMTGVKLEGSGIPETELFLTNLEIDRVIRNLLLESGYQITVK